MIETVCKVPRGRLGRLGVLAALVAVAAPAAPASAQDGSDPDFITLGVGAFDVNDDQDSAAQFEAQVRFDEQLWIFKPQAGLFVTSEGSFYVYGGVLVDIYLGRRLVLSPSFAVGAYEKSNGKDLGGLVEFRSAIELAYRFDDRSRLGLQYGHLSHAGIYSDNPGENFLILNYSIPTGVFER